MRQRGLEKQLNGICQAHYSANEFSPPVKWQKKGKKVSLFHYAHQLS
jgi:hypothetical protein